MDLIDRQALLAEVRDDIRRGCFAQQTVINNIEYAPTVEPKRGEWIEDAVALYETADNIVTRIVATKLSHALVDPYLGMEIDKFVVNVQQFLSYLIDDFGADMRGDNN